MFLPIFISFCVLLIGYLFWFERSTPNRNRLPGPTPLPLIGNLLQIGFLPHIKFMKWAKLYGPIYGIKLGLTRAIIVSDHKLIEELFSNPAAFGRMIDNKILLEVTKGPYGVANTSGLTWESQRKFTFQTLRNLGFIGTSMENMILDEVKIFLNWFRNQEDAFIPNVRIFTGPVLNPIWCIINGERGQWEEGQVTIFNAVDNLNKALKLITTKGLVFAPNLKLIAPNFFGWTQYMKSIDVFRTELQNCIEKHKRNFNSTELRNYIDHHLFKIGNETDSESSHYGETGEANMLANILEVILGGAETIPVTLCWAMLYLSENQNVQKNLQDEIDQVVGKTLPSLSNRPNMPYCKAVISEVMRISSVAAVGVPHTMLSDLNFHGYHLSKGTTVFSNLYGVHHDPEVWGDPENFRPERFLSEDKTKFVQNEALIPFSEGKRKCIGENFTMDSLFLYVTSIFQNFTILPSFENKPKTQFKPAFAFILSPKPFKILVKAR